MATPHPSNYEEIAGMPAMCKDSNAPFYRTEPELVLVPYQNVDDVADFHGHGAVVFHELPGGHQAFGFEADVYLDELFIDGKDCAPGDFALFC